MGVENGEWIMHGPSWDEPGCIHSVDEAMDWIRELGFLPLFQNEIPGFSLEERTDPKYWWSDNPERDAWMWRTVIARQDDILYGKFFGKKAGFIAREWVPAFANFRRNGYDFDSLYEDGLANRKQKMIMDHFVNEQGEYKDVRILSNELRKMAGFGKEGAHGYEGTITNLMMQLYLCNCDFRKRKNKQGKEYGWDVAVYTTPENILGYDQVTACYNEKPRESWQRLVEHLRENFPVTSVEIIRKVLK